MGEYNDNIWIWRGIMSPKDTQWLCLCVVVPGLPNSPCGIGQVGDDILKDLLEILINLRRKENISINMDQK